MLETMQERVELLKVGISGRDIEELYIRGNDIKIVNLNLLNENKKILLRKLNA
jgi:hypothetical protein